MMEIRDIQQVAGNPRRRRFTTESQRERRLKIHREQRNEIREVLASIWIVNILVLTQYS